MNKALDIVYVNNTLLGHFIDNVYVSYTKDEKEKILLDIEKEVAKKDYNRKMFSMLIGVSLAFIALLIAFLMLIEVITLGTGQWFNYTYLVTGLFLLWVILYYFLGLIFYPSVKINFHFKSHKANNINSCVTFASSNYSKFIDKYTEEDQSQFEGYLAKQMEKIDLPNKDMDFLRHYMLTMYANPAINHLKAIKA